MQTPWHRPRMDRGELEKVICLQSKNRFLYYLDEIDLREANKRPFLFYNKSL